jgi:hypothetical protein
MNCKDLSYLRSCVTAPSAVSSFSAPMRALVDY